MDRESRGSAVSGAFPEISPDEQAWKITEQEEKRERAQTIREGEYNSNRYDQITPSQAFARAIIVKVAKEMWLYLAILENQFVAYKGKIARPDFLFTRYGWVIEIDGGVHNQELKMLTDWKAWEDIFEPLGLQVYRINSEDLYSAKGQIQFRKNLKEIFSNPLEKKKADAIRAKISQHRGRLDNECVLKNADLERFRKNERENQGRNRKLFAPFPSWGGTILNVAPTTRNKRETAEPADLDQLKKAFLKSGKVITQLPAAPPKRIR